jgi:hypothetical protein
MELFVMILMCAMCATIITVWLFEQYDKKFNIPYVVDNDFLLMEDNTKALYTTGFAKAKYIRPGSYIQDINCYQPVYDESTGVMRIVDNSDTAGEPCSVSPVTLSENIKENIREKKGE